MLFRSFLLLALTLPLGAFAEVNPPPFAEVCSINDNWRLTQNTQVYCKDSDLRIAPGVKIVTQGFLLQIVALKEIAFGLAGKAAVQILSFDGVNTSTNRSAQLIYIQTFEAASGNLFIQNDGLTSLDAPGSVTLNFLATRNYDHKILVASDAVVSLTRSGQPLRSVGPDHKFPATDL